MSDRHKRSFIKDSNIFYIRHIKDMEDKKETQISQDKGDISSSLIVLEIFEKDNFLLFVYKKVERIVSASYLLSNLFSDKEPIKWQFRESGVGILSHIMSLTANPFSKPATISEIAPELLKLLSLLNISFTAGFVSEMNFNILKKELENLVETLHAKSINKLPQDGKKPEINKEFFSLPHDSFLLQDKENFRERNPSSEAENRASKVVADTWSDVIRLSNIYKRHDKGQNIKDKESLTKSPTEIFSNIVNKGRNVVNNKSNTNEVRRTAIMKLLNDGNSLTIRDFSLVIKGCSEKTIQRELIRLVRTGVLKKTGQRRWSRYSLIQS